jgi:hypothetical protein
MLIVGVLFCICCLCNHSELQAALGISSKERALRLLERANGCVETAAEYFYDGEEEGENDHDVVVVTPSADTSEAPSPAASTDKVAGAPGLRDMLKGGGSTPKGATPKKGSKRTETKKPVRRCQTSSTCRHNSSYNVAYMNSCNILINVPSPLVLDACLFGTTGGAPPSQQEGKGLLLRGGTGGRRPTQHYILLWRRWRGSCAARTGYGRRVEADHAGSIPQAKHIHRPSCVSQVITSAGRPDIHHERGEGVGQGQGEAGSGGREGWGRRGGGG